MCDLLLKDILHLPQHQGSVPQHFTRKLYTRGSCGRGFLFSPNFDQHQSRYRGANPVRGDDSGASFVKSCAVHVLGRPFTCWEEVMDLPDNSGLFQHQTTHSGMSPYKRTEFTECLPHSSSLGQRLGDHDELMLFNCIPHHSPVWEFFLLSLTDPTEAHKNYSRASVSMSLTSNKIADSYEGTPNNITVCCVPFNEQPLGILRPKEIWNDSCKTQHSLSQVGASELHYLEHFTCPSAFIPKAGNHLHSETARVKVGKLHYPESCAACGDDRQSQ
ncbi:hypothetical protein HPG69_007279 [Diceros bicornis minor]|uniref:Uncharacterized protein n=1 Tax=Diceros bicornis minor TaxID=77932 RepID=A0A7J7FPN9_DICBM|nr:hypothetical protein HPG69_007279 [Diceros bicornis minor]